MLRQLLLEISAYNGPMEEGWKEMASEALTRMDAPGELLDKLIQAWTSTDNCMVPPVEELENPLNRYLGKAEREHPNLLFPVIVDVLNEDRENSPREIHGLIYTDLSVALTMYENCYAIWHLKDGSCLGGRLWASKEYRLSTESIAEIRRYYGETE